MTKPTKIYNHACKQLPNIHCPQMYTTVHTPSVKTHTDNTGAPENRFHTQLHTHNSCTFQTHETHKSSHTHSTVHSSTMCLPTH
jgi:hypothetical protein